jgi:hypothetical protein
MKQAVSNPSLVLEWSTCESSRVSSGVGPVDVSSDGGVGTVVPVAALGASDVVPDSGSKVSTAGVQPATSAEHPNNVSSPRFTPENYQKFLLVWKCYF